MSEQQLPAGRELDAWVHEKVMGHPVAEHRNADGTLTRHWLDGYMADGTYYSTDIAAAWLLVDALSVKGCELILEDWRSNPVPNWAALFNLPSGHDTGQILAPTAPLAICRAALQAMRQMKP